MKMNSLINSIKRVPLYIWLLILIMAVGIYLRTYHFHDWLYFYPDQARDALVVKDYLGGKIPLPLMGFRAASTNFDLGAMYYYFQILSGKMFGVAPDKMAYPDLFFNILAIPLFFYFLKRYFRTGISLALTAIYSFSFYAIEYSRFAWNPNPMPFFVLLYLLSLWKFLTEKEKTRWGWIAAIGVSIGVGIQLHTILIFLLSSVSLIALIISMKNNWRLWSRWLAILAIAMLLNTNQIISEINHHFSNTKRLFNLSATSASETSGTVAKENKLALDVVCHAQANAHMISSLGNKVDCNYLTAMGMIRQQIQFGVPVQWTIVGEIASGLLFSLFGYGLLVYFYRREKDQKKKTFLGLISLYIGFSFAIIYPIILDAPLRYYLQLFFVPYLFLGFMLELVRRNYARAFLPAMLAICALLVGFNLKTLSSEAKLYASNNHSQPQYVVLGELLHMRDYIVFQTNSQRTVYMIAEGKYMQNYYLPLLYVLQEKDITLLRELKDLNKIPSDVPIFLVTKSGRTGQAIDTKGFSLKQYQNFGEIGIYILNSKERSQTNSQSIMLNK